MKVTSYNELRNNPETYLDRVVSDSEPLIVNMPGNNNVVIITLDEYNAIKETEYLSSPAMMEAIRNSEKDIETGSVISQEDGESITDFLNRISCIK